MPEYCNEADLVARLTQAGLLSLVDGDRNGVIGDSERQSLIEPAIRAAGGELDAALAERHDLEAARTANNPFLRDRAADLAAEKLALLGGAPPPPGIRRLADRSRRLLSGIRAGDPIPGLAPSSPSAARRERGRPRVVDPER
jgi:hypothetical protein